MISVYNKVKELDLIGWVILITKSDFESFAKNMLVYIREELFSITLRLFSA